MIDKNRNNNLKANQKNRQDNYNYEHKAIDMKRKQSHDQYNGFVSDYNQRVDQTWKQSLAIKKQSRQLEKIEELHLKKLQHTFSLEKRV